MREPVWSLIRNWCPSFSEMAADAVFSDIFTLRIGDLTDYLKSLFLVKHLNQTCCRLCGSHTVKGTSTIVLYITYQNIAHTEFQNCVSEAALPDSRPLFCYMCKEHCGDISASQYFVTLPELLCIELSANSIDQIVFP